MPRRVFDSDRELGGNAEDCSIGSPHAHTRQRRQLFHRHPSGARRSGLSGTRAASSNAFPPRRWRRFASTCSSRLRSRSGSPNATAPTSGQPSSQPVVAGVLAPHPLERLEQAALAAWYARRMQRRFQDLATTVSVPVAEQSAEVKGRMLKLIDYAFGDDSRFSPRIAAIRSGRATRTWPMICRSSPTSTTSPSSRRWSPRTRSTIASTTTWRTRGGLAGDIFKALGLTSDGEKWTGRVQQRAYTHLTDVYTEHCYAGSLLFFRREDVSTTCSPSLIGVVRSPANRNRDASAGAGNRTAQRPRRARTTRPRQARPARRGRATTTAGADAAGGQSTQESAGGGNPGDANPSGGAGANDG